VDSSHDISKINLASTSIDSSQMKLPFIKNRSRVSKAILMPHLTGKLKVEALDQSTLSDV
jgi:hypothetical protein